jgi:hypothetical protein
MAAYLADTNILLYLVNPAAPEHAGSARRLGRILANGDSGAGRADSLRVLERCDPSGRDQRSGLVSGAGRGSDSRHPQPFFSFGWSLPRFWVCGWIW